MSAKKKLPTGEASYLVDREDVRRVIISPDEFRQVDKKHVEARELLDSFFQGRNLTPEQRKRRSALLDKRTAADKNTQPDQYLKNHVNKILNNNDKYRSLSLFVQGFGRRGEASTALFPAILGITNKEPWSPDLLLKSLVEGGIVTPNVTLEENLEAVKDLIQAQTGWFREDTTVKKVSAVPTWMYVASILAVTLSIAGFNHVLAMYCVPFITVLAFYIQRVNIYPEVTTKRVEVDLEQVCDKILMAILPSLRLIQEQGLFERHYQTNVIKELINGE